MKQNYLDGSLFAILFLQGKHAIAALLKMLFWTPDFSLDIDIGLLNYKYSFYGRNLIFDFELFELAILSPACPDFLKIQVKLGRFDEKK